MLQKAENGYHPLYGMFGTVQARQEGLSSVSEPSLLQQTERIGVCAPDTAKVSFEFVRDSGHDQGADGKVPVQLPIVLWQV